MTEFKITRDTADAAAIRSHLSACDAVFIPRLSDRVDVSAYAAKINANAHCFEAWSGEALVGLVAVYCNAPERATAFITSVSVLPHAQGKGLASQLMERCLAGTRELNFQRVELRVGTGNASAIALYTKLGFSVASEAEGMATMALDL